MRISKRGMGDRVSRNIECVVSISPTSTITDTIACDDTNGNDRDANRTTDIWVSTLQNDGHSALCWSFRWTARAETHWIGPQIGQVLTAVGLMLAFNSIQHLWVWLSTIMLETKELTCNSIVDAFFPYSAAAVAAATAVSAVSDFIVERKLRSADSLNLNIRSSYFRCRHVYGSRLGMGWNTSSGHSGGCYTGPNDCKFRLNLICFAVDWELISLDVCVRSKTEGTICFWRIITTSPKSLKVIWPVVFLVLRSLGFVVRIL
jgi:hypothetical protein